MPSGGLAGVGVPPSQPVWLLYIKAVVIVLSLVVMGLSGYVLSNQFIQGGPASLDMFTVCNRISAPPCPRANAM